MQNHERTDDESLKHFKLPQSQEPFPASALHQKASQLISSYQTSPSITDLPPTLRTLLTIIIKPLFSTNHHPSLAPSGRKAQFAPPPTFPHSEPLILDDSDKPWKQCFNTLTAPLLRSIIASYPDLPQDLIKPTLEDHFFLLTPALLNMIDDSSAHVKTTGFTLLQSLSTLLHNNSSEILHRSGLVAVFITAAQSSFMLLPTLTPESESLQILGALYPALLAVIAAEFPTLPTFPTALSGSASSKDPEPIRQNNLTLLLRHGLLASLSHLNAGVSTSHPGLTALLLRQVHDTIQGMGIYAVVHLQYLIPLLRAVVTEPFSLAAPEGVLAALACLAELVSLEGVKRRVGQAWWGEVLRGVVGCWCAVVDEEGDVDGMGRGEMEVVKGKLREVTRKLGLVVEKDVWEEAKRRLCEEEAELEDLFQS